MLIKTHLLAVKVLLLVAAAYAIPLANFSRFGSIAGDSFLPRGDDENVLVAVSPPLQFFNATHTNVYVSVHCNKISLLIFMPDVIYCVVVQVSTNGAVTAGDQIVNFNPGPFPDNDELIAPFWSDVDTRAAGNVSYRASTAVADLDFARDYIQRGFPAQPLFNPQFALVATWEGVGYFNQRSNLVRECFKLDF